MRLPARPTLLGTVILLLLCAGGFASSLAPSSGAAPEQELPDALQAQEVVSNRGMVVTASGAASRAGARMLETGGNAIDAAVAAAFALGVVDPGSSGVGGQTYLLIYLADGRSVAIDGSARAPLHYSVDELQQLRDQAVWKNLLYGPKSVATPGSVAALALALARYGSKSLAEVVAPAIELAEIGSVWSAAHRAFVVKYGIKVQASAYLSGLFLKDGIEAWDERHLYCNPDLACFLRRLATVGAADFYHGAIAREIEQDMIATGGWLRRGDLGLLEAEVKPPLRGRYRGLEMLSFPFPGGGAAVVEALGILDRFPPELLRGSSVDRAHLLLEACRIAAADCFPARRPLRRPDDLAASPAFLAARAALVRFDRALYNREISSHPLSTLVIDGTTQVSTADSSGNAVSLTQTLGPQFGGGAATTGWGFAYNGLMSGFEFSDPRQRTYIAPRQPPINTLAPTIVLKDGKPLLVIGSAGSARIAPLIVGTVSAVVDGGLTLREAMARPRVLWGGNADDQSYIEMVGEITDAVADALTARGFRRQRRLTYPASALDLTDFGGVNAIRIDPVDGRMEGVGDPRRQGVAAAPMSPPPAAERLLIPDCWRSLYVAN